jgi:rubredoxin
MRKFETKKILRAKIAELQEIVDEYEALKKAEAIRRSELLAQYQASVKYTKLHSVVECPRCSGDGYVLVGLAQYRCYLCGYPAPEQPVPLSKMEALIHWRNVWQQRDKDANE